MMPEPFGYSPNELENTKIFSGIDDDDSTGLSGLFDDDEGEDEDEDEDDNGDVKIKVSKTTTHNGVKLMKDMVVAVSKDDAEKLVSDKKAEYIE